MRFYYVILFFIMLSSASWAADLVGPACPSPNAESDRSDLRVFEGMRIVVNDQKLRKEVLRKYKYSGNVTYGTKRRWFNAKVIVKFADLECEYQAKIRPTGDYNDHIEITKDKFRSSLLVSLKNGAINGIVRFKLFIPKTRNGWNEVYASNLLSVLGYLSPRTGIFNVKINNESYYFIVQEDLAKEFLEFNKKNEGPIFEGNESYGISEQMSNARLANEKWAERSPVHMEIAVNGLSILNYAYLLNHDFARRDSQESFTDLTNTTPLLQGPSPWSPEVSEFNALVFALRATHLLTKDDLRLYYDPAYGTFHPIYYDGSSLFLENVEAKKYVTQSMKDGYREARKKVDNINLEELSLKLKKSGFKINEKELAVLLGRLKTNLDQILNINLHHIDYKQVVTRRELFEGFREKNVSGFVVWDEYLKNWAHCEKKLIQKCEPVKEINGELINGLNLDTEGGLYKVFLGYLDIDDKIKISLNPRKLSLLNYRPVVLPDGTEIYKQDGVYLNLDNAKKIISVRLGSDQQILFKSGVLSGWSIKVLGKPGNLIPKNLSRLYSTGLTGCLNFRDLQVKNLSIIVENTDCEDAVNFTRVNGSIDSINIKNAYQDGLDADFSNLNIKTVSVVNAGNDCIDFSYGNYMINHANVISCNDKGVSVGELAKLDANDLNISKSNTAIAVKDSAFVKVRNLKAIKFKKCASVYRKKQEFLGGSLFLNNSNCNNESITVQHNSVFGKYGR